MQGSRIAACLGILALFCPITSTAQQAATGSSLLPQFVFGDGWYTAMYFTNLSGQSVSFPVYFYSDFRDALDRTVPKWEFHAGDDSGKWHSHDRGHKRGQPEAGVCNLHSAGWRGRLWLLPCEPAGRTRSGSGGTLCQFEWHY